MSKIDKYKAAAASAAALRRSVDAALGKDSPRNDKHTATCYFTGLSKASFAPMEMQIDCSYGYYGRSSGYSATSKDMGERLAKAITAYMPRLLEECVAAAERDAENARKEAEDEARAVLTEMKMVTA